MAGEDPEQVWMLSEEKNSNRDGSRVTYRPKRSLVTITTTPISA
jgi:hypothetical protein